MIEKTDSTERYNNANPTIQAQSPEMPRFINVGHPLGYVDIGGTIMNSLDIGSCNVNISHNDFRIWNTLHVKMYDEPMLMSLISKNLVLDLKYQEHRKKFFECVLYRQGFGCAFDKKHAIQLGVLPINVTELQMKIWRMANGINTTENILQSLSVDIETLLENITTLLKLDLIYIKYQM